MENFKTYDTGVCHFLRNISFRVFNKRKKTVFSVFEQMYVFTLHNSVEFLKISLLYNSVYEISLPSFL